MFSTCELTISTVHSDDSDVETLGSDAEASDTVIDTEEKMLQFNFESSDNLELLDGTHGLMPFSGAVNNLRVKKHDAANINQR